jgi:hypothetical protein
MRETNKNPKIKRVFKLGMNPKGAYVKWYTQTKLLILKLLLLSVVLPPTPKVFLEKKIYLLVVQFQTKQPTNYIL